MNVNPERVRTSNKTAKAKKAPSQRAPKAASSTTRRSNAENYGSQTNVQDFVDMHLVVS